MKISCNILGTSKNIARLRVLCAKAIRSFKHDVEMNFYAEGERPDFLPRDWNWIPSSHIEKSDRHVFALREHVIKNSDDFSIFCDDDVMMDLDKFCEFAKNYENEPTVFSAHPGSLLEDWCLPLVTKYFKNYEIDRNTFWMGWCTTAVNRKFVENVSEKPELLNSLMSLSQELGKIQFIPDRQISILGHIIKAKHINGLDSGATGWPAFLQSSVLNSQGRLWHIHHTGENPLITNNKLIETLNRNEPLEIENLIDSLFHNINRGIKQKNWSNKEFDVGWFWCPWTGKRNPTNSNSKLFNNCIMLEKNECVMNMGHKNQEFICKWEACRDGFSIVFDNNDRLVCKWDDGESIIGYPDVKSHHFGHMVRIIKRH